MTRRRVFLSIEKNENIWNESISASELNTQITYEASKRGYYARSGVSYFRISTEFLGLPRTTRVYHTFLVLSLIPWGSTTSKKWARHYVSAFLRSCALTKGDICLFMRLHRWCYRRNVMFLGRMQAEIGSFLSYSRSYIRSFHVYWVFGTWVAIAQVSLFP